MRQAELNRAVALATGESVATVRRLGFLLARVAARDEERPPHIIDWDDFQAPRCREASPPYAPAYL